MFYKENVLPITGYIRLPVIIGDPKAKPPIQPIIPVSRTTWLKGVKSGLYPAPIKLGKRAVGWKVGDIRVLLEVLGG